MQVLSAIIIMVTMAWAIPASLHAGHVLLKNGILIEGEPVPMQAMNAAISRQHAGPITTYPLMLVDDGMVRYFVSSRQVEDLQREPAGLGVQKFELTHKKQGRSMTIESLGRVDERTIFDEYGRRSVTVATPRGPVHIVQGITKITPRYVTVTGLTHVWEHGLRTSSIDPPIIDAILRRITDPADVQDRMEIATFYLQAGRYLEADRELDDIGKQFPHMTERVGELRAKLRALWADKLLTELRQRQSAGQHRLAYAAAREFPVEKMSAAVVRQMNEIVSTYDEARVRAESAIALLGEQQAELDDPTRVARVAPMRTIVRENLNYESLGRLDAFLNFSDDESLSADEKLALAYSGWILGNAHAITDLRTTMRLWDARFLVLEYLRSEKSSRRAEIMNSLKELDGVDPQRIEWMIAHLPPWLESAEIRPGEPHRVTVAGTEIRPGESQPDVEYTVLLPREYDPQHTYPLIVALRPRERTCREEVEWWGIIRKHVDDPGVPGQSQRRGYIVIAPEYADDKSTGHDYGAMSHYAVLQALRDARKRFLIDSDRVFLSGHGMGGDAAFDLGMSHPDEFAGVIPLVGVCGGYCKWYWQNAQDVPWYVVNGQLDRDTVSQNARELDRLMRHGGDVIYAEYEGRGYESYYEEIHRLFDWMDKHRRRRNVKEFEVFAMRPFDNRFYWLRADGFPSKMMAANARVLLPAKTRGRPVSPRPLKVSGRITPGNTIYIESAATRATLWLNPELVDFGKRVEVRWKGRQVYNEFPQPSLETMLEDLRIRGDRQQLFTVQLTFD